MLNESVTTRDIAPLLGISERAVRKRAQQENWLHSEVSCRGGKRWSFKLKDLPGNIQKDLSSKSKIDPSLLPVLAPGAALEAAAQTIDYNPGLSGDSAATDTWSKETAIDLQVVRDPKVAKWVNIIQEALDVPRGYKKRQWIEAVAQKHATTFQYVYQKIANYKKKGLIGLSHRKSNRNQPKRWTPEAVDWWIGLCLKKEHRKMAQDGKRGVLYPLLLDEAEKKGWQVGSYSSALWWLRKRLNPQLLALQRGGRRALDNTLPPVLRNYADLSPFEILVGDQHRFDFWVLDEDSGEVFRPEGYFWQDLRTRCFYGGALDRKYDSYLMGLALRMGLRIFGAFESIYTDHGKPEESRYIMGILKDMHGIGLKVERTVEAEVEQETDPELLNPLAVTGLHRKAIVRNAKAKMIEGTFDVLENILRNVFKVPGYVKKLAGSQEENEIDEKELKFLAETGRLLTFREFFLTVLKALDFYNTQKVHRGVSREWTWKFKPKNITPMDCLKACYTDGWRPFELKSEEIDVVFLARGDRPRVVDRGRILFRNETYEHEDLIDLHKQEVDLRFDPADPEWVLVFLKDRFICKAGLVEYSSMKDTDLARRKIAEKSRRRQGFILEYRHLTSRIPDIREFSTVPAAEKAAAALGQGKALQVERQKAASELSRPRTPGELAAEVARLEEKGQTKPKARHLPKRPDYFLTDLDRHGWIVKYELAGGVLSQEDTAFKSAYEAGLTAEQREYLETVRMVNEKS